MINEENKYKVKYITPRESGKAYSDITRMIFNYLSGSHLGKKIEIEVVNSDYERKYNELKECLKDIKKVKCAGDFSNFLHKYDYILKDLK